MIRRVCATRAEASGRSYEEDDDGDMIQENLMEVRETINREGRMKVGNSCEGHMHLHQLLKHPAVRFFFRFSFSALDSTPHFCQL